MKNLFNLENFSKENAKIANPQMLAFVGDAVFSLYIRNKVVLENSEKIKELHSKTSQLVKAGEQSYFIDKILEMLDETEMAIYKRARNYKTQNIAKNAKVIDYKKATGFEAVLGYLYLTGEIDRLNEILKECNDENRG